MLWLPGLEVESGEGLSVAHQGVLQEVQQEHMLEEVVVEEPSLIMDLELLLEVQCTVHLVLVLLVEAMGCTALVLLDMGTTLLFPWV